MSDIIWGVMYYQPSKGKANWYPCPSEDDAYKQICHKVQNIISREWDLYNCNQDSLNAAKAINDAIIAKNYRQVPFIWNQVNSGNDRATLFYVSSKTMSDPQPDPPIRDASEFPSSNQEVVQGVKDKETT
jgi:hypothetical protein